jgi:twinkle protein
VNINVNGDKKHINSTSNTVDRPADTANSKYGLTPPTTVYHAVDHRKINLQAAQKYGIDVVLNDDRVEARYPYFISGKHVANKVRTKDKKFWWEYESKDNINKVELFGQHLFPSGSAKQITLVEGEYDAPAAWTLLGSRYPVVSVASAGTALRDVKNNFEYLDSFERIVLCLDSDEVGQKTAKQIADLFKPGKCRVLALQDGKDPNAYLAMGLRDKFVDEWYKAPAYMPDGLKIGSEMWDEIVNRPKHFQVDYPFAGLNKLTYGLRLSEMVVLTADTGIGKTSILKEVEYSLLMNPELKEKGYGVGFLHLEEPNYDTALGLMSIHANKPFHLPDTERTTEELRNAYDNVICTDRVVIWDHFGSNTVDAVLDKIRHMHALGCKYIILDHLSIVVSDQSGDERKQLDEIATKAKTLCMNLNIALLVVIHQNRQGTIRGTAGVEQLANIVIKLYRDNKDNNEWRRNVTKVMVEKNRFCGRTGPACWLWYNGITGRLEELTQEQSEEYESGNSIADDHIAF